MICDRTLSSSTVTHVINAPIEKVDIADWLFNLPDAEYQRCSGAHIAAGITTTDDGHPMSINVETVGDALVIQHYVAEVRKPHLCRLVSISDTVTAKGRTKVQVIWELSATKTDNHTMYAITFMPARRTTSWRSCKRMASLSNEPKPRGRRQRTPITLKRHRTSPGASSGEPCNEPD